MIEYISYYYNLIQNKNKEDLITFIFVSFLLIVLNFTFIYHSDYIKLNIISSIFTVIVISIIGIVLYSKYKNNKIEKVYSLPKFTPYPIIHLEKFFNQKIIMSYIKKDGVLSFTNAEDEMIEKDGVYITNKLHYTLHLKDNVFSFYIRKEPVIVVNGKYNKDLFNLIVHMLVYCYLKKGNNLNRSEPKEALLLLLKLNSSSINPDFEKDLDYHTIVNIIQHFINQYRN